MWYFIRAFWRDVRVSCIVTRIIGYQYRRSRELIEIDITYACNLHCLNCNRSVRQAPEALHMPLSMIIKFVNDSIRRRKHWKRIRVLGGEPTVHPEFIEIIAELLRYRSSFPNSIIEVVTNGHGELVESRLRQLPPDIWIENSSKQSSTQPLFRPFNLAPTDDPRYRHADFNNGCAIMHECGMGLTPLGYYPCAVAGGIDRITQQRLGRDELPSDDDDMQEAVAPLCRLCGRFKDGHFVPKNLREPLLDEQMSPTWQKLYDDWRKRKSANDVSSEVLKSSE